MEQTIVDYIRQLISSDLALKSYKLIWILIFFFYSNRRFNILLIIDLQISHLTQFILYAYLFRKRHRGIILYCKLHYKLGPAI